MASIWELFQISDLLRIGSASSRPNGVTKNRGSAIILKEEHHKMLPSSVGYGETMKAAHIEAGYNRVQSREAGFREINKRS